MALSLQREEGLHHVLGEVGPCVYYNAFNEGLYYGMVVFGDIDWRTQGFTAEKPCRRSDGDPARDDVGRPMQVLPLSSPTLLQQSLYDSCHI